VEKAVRDGHLSIEEGNTMIVFDMLSEFGIKSRVSYEDYLEGFENLRKIW
jgi:hypothetical protein